MREENGKLMELAKRQKAELATLRAANKRLNDNIDAFTARGDV